jgi:methionyl-tRNA formyltransferase
MIKILFFGSYSFSLEYLKVLHCSDKIKITGIVSRPDNTELNPVKSWCLKKKLDKLLFQPKSLKPNQIHQQLIGLNSDLIFCAAYSLKIPSKLINKTKLGGVNIHPSLLPELRGPDPIRRAILEGAKRTGVTIHKLTKNYDCGDIYWKKAIEIGHRDNTEDLINKIILRSKLHIVDVLQKIQNQTIKPIPQKGSSTYAHSVKDYERVISNSFTIKKVNLLVRALSPFKPAIWDQGAYRYLIYNKNVKKNEDPIVIKLKDGDYKTRFYVKEKKHE